MVRVAVIASIVATGLGSEEGTMRKVFDELTRFGTRVPLVRYPEAHWDAITACMATAGQLFPAGADAAWAGWTKFGLEGGSASDPWDVHNKPSGGHYKEYDPRNLSHAGGKIPIIEPCNTISNLAYYRIIPELCNTKSALSYSDAYVSAIIQGFATLGMGSSFMHGSRTELGCVMDNAPIDVIAYQYLQHMNSALGNSSVLQELSSTPRAYDGRQLAEKISTIPLELDVDNWLEAVNRLDRPQYFFTFAAIVVNALTLLLPPTLSDKVVPALMSLFQLEDDVQAFILKSYLPAVRDATADVKLDLKSKARLLKEFAGTMVKLLYAFVWQEEIFQYKLVYNMEWNVLGALLTPAVNSLANRLTGFLHSDETIQKSEAVYPGQDFCKVKHTAPHAKWHEISANGLMDLAYMADRVKTAIEAGKREVEVAAEEPGIPVSMVEDWAQELAKQPLSEASAASAAFVPAVRQIVEDMDSCNGAADGQVTAADMACYVATIDSREGFVGDLFHAVSGKMAEESTLLV